MSSGMPFTNFISLTEPFGPPSPLRAVVGDDDDQRVLALAGLLEVVEQPADLVVGVGEEPGVHLGHPGEQRFSSSDSESHGRVSSTAGNGLPSGPVRVSGVPIGLIGGSSVSAGTMPSSFWRASVCSRIAS